MKRLILICALAALALAAPLAQAQSCSPYLCRLGNCPYWELLVDTSFTSPSCSAWYYTGSGALTSGDICNWTNTAFAQLEYTGGMMHTSSVAQNVTARNNANDLDSFDLSYIIEIDNMSAGDTVKVAITDLTTGIKVTSETFTADTWCNSVTHHFSGKGWLGHTLQVKWTSNFASTGTTAKITNAALWQQYTP